MNITTRPGAKIMVTENTSQSGYTSDIEKVKRYLTLNTPYTVESLDVDRWHTDVYIKEVPGVPFNSSNFVNLDENYEQEENPFIDEINEEMGLNDIPPHASGG